MTSNVDGGAPPRRGSRWNDPKFRSVIFQILALAAVFGFGYFIFQNTLNNLEKQGIASGFDFLERNSGFGVSMSLIEYSESSSYGRAFFVALLNTLLVSVVGIFFATLLVVLGVNTLNTA